MSIEDIRPSSLPSIRRIAKQLKKANGIPYRKALDSAARQGNFANFEHARKHLSALADKEKASHRVFLTAYWVDDDTYEQGREVLEVELARPLLEICTKAELKRARGLAALRMVSQDHLVRDHVGPSQSFIRGELCKAARGLHFMQMTGLRPCAYDKAGDAMQGLDGKLPDKDHASNWYDPKTNQFVLIDEPYSNPIVSRERAEWAERNGWHLEGSSWPGLYFPYQCGLFLATPKDGALNFEKLMDTVNAMPEPVTAENWTGESEPGHETFVSPLTQTPQDKRRAKSKGTVIPRSSSKTVPYHRDMLGADRKPNGSMTLVEHQRAGKLIRAVLQSEYKPGAVNRRMDRLMQVLVDWLYADVPTRELETLYDPIDVYYGEMSRNDADFLRANSAQGVLETLAELKGLLSSAYPDCEPLRKLTRRIETAAKITRRQMPNDKTG